MRTSSLKILTIIIGLVAIIATGGVFATWHYSQGSLKSITTNLTITTSPWEGSEILPDDLVGQNHRQLIENILNGKMTDNKGKEIGIGLNAPNSELNQQLDSRENRNKTTFGSMDAWDSAQMNSLFGLEAAKLSFMLEFNENEPNVKYLYTTGVYLGTSGNILGWPKPNPTFEIGEIIYPIYRTKLIYKNIGKDNKGKDVYEWVAEQTVLGSAKSAYYDNDYLGSFAVKNPAFDVTTFAPINQEDCESGETARPLGNSVSNAIALYVGETVMEYPKDTQTVIYFTLTPENAGTVTITSTESSGAYNMTIYSDSQLENAIASTTYGQTLTFDAIGGATYYIKAYGNIVISFKIEQ